MYTINWPDAATLNGGRRRRGFFSRSTMSRDLLWLRGRLARAAAALSIRAECPVSYRRSRV